MDLTSVVTGIQDKMTREHQILPEYLAHVNAETELFLPSIEIGENRIFRIGYREDKEAEPGTYILFHPENVDQMRFFRRKFVNIGDVSYNGCKIYTTGMDWETFDLLREDHEVKINGEIYDKVAHLYKYQFPLLVSGPYG